MRLSFVVKTFLVLIFSFQPFSLNASHIEELRKDNELISVVFSSWVIGKEIKDEEKEKILKSIESSQDIYQTLTTLVNGMVACGGSSSEIEQLFAYNGFEIPNSAKLDCGAHQVFLGRSSLLGSFGANLKGMSRIGLFRWCFDNAMPLLTYYATIQSVLGLVMPVAAIDVVPDAVCSMPHGSFEASCHNTTIVHYRSSDPLVPMDSCKLTTSCESIIPSIPSTPNTLYYQATDGLTLGNNNGTLVVLNSASQGTPITEVSQVIKCQPLPGSHERTCELKVEPYVSTDPNLQSTSFCKMASNCKKVDGKEVGAQNTVYYGHQQLQGTDVAVENCDGKAIIHSSKNLDGMCDHVSHDKVREIAADKGKDVHVLKLKKKDEF